MTVQEAIEVLEVFTTEKFQCLTSSEFDDAICCAIKSLEKKSKLDSMIKRLEDNSFWTEATFDEEGYCNDDSEKFIGLGVAIEIIGQEMM